MGVVRRAPGLREGHGSRRHHRLVKLPSTHEGDVTDLREVGADVVLQHEQLASLEHDEVDRELAAPPPPARANQLRGRRGRGCRRAGGSGSTVMVAAQGAGSRPLAGLRAMDGGQAGEQTSLLGRRSVERAACVCFIFCGRIVRAACAPHRGTDVHDRDRQTRRQLRMAK